MSEPLQFVLRPLERRIPEGALEGGFRVHLSAKDLKTLGLEPGDACKLRALGGASGVGIAWLSQELKPSGSKRITQVTDIFRETYGFNLQDRVSICKSELPFTRADTVVLNEITEGQLEHSPRQEALRCWIDVSLLHLDAIVPGGYFELRQKDSTRSRKRRFRVEKVEADACSESRQAYFYDHESRFKFDNDPELPGRRFPERQPAEKQTALQTVIGIDSEGIGGLQKAVEKLNEQLLDVTGHVTGLRLSSHLRRNGVLLYGSEGTGKTLLLEKLAAAPWKKVLRVDEATLGPYLKESQKALQKIFVEARASQPSIILLDDLESIAGKDNEQAANNSLKRTLISELESLQGTQVLAVAATVSLNAIDKRLRTLRSFGTEIEIPVPDANARSEILRILLGKDRGSPDSLCETIGQLTHGYVGKDLGMLCAVARDQAVRSFKLRSSSSAVYGKLHAIDDTASVAQEEGASEEISAVISDVDLITEDDFRQGLLQVRPTAMKEVFLETPKVRWADIGGSEEVKRALYKVTERPFKRPDVLRGLNIEPQKGILLYGPPGCSKTLTAKALATEAGLNFLAVKGAELTSMYVGESERAIREIFRKARAASPSIIFFDEIDSIGAASEKGSHTVGLNVVTTLLNEMDGIESLRGVLVLAATNKPDILDSALLRPGRFDTLLYVGPPNLEARKQIFQIGTRDRPLADDVDIDALAQRTGGFSGAEIINICTQAAEATADDRERESNNGLKISQKHFEDVLAGFKSQITWEMTRKYELWKSGGATRLEV